MYETIPSLHSVNSLQLRQLPASRRGSLSIISMGRCRYVRWEPTLLGLPGLRGSGNFRLTLGCFVRLARMKEPAVSITVRELATWVDGEFAGNGEQQIEHARPLADAEPGDIT